ncbi:flagellar hook-associated family protein [Methylobacterium sp. Leaf112]|uniref:flagellar hook-associated family protein n=1 Tax=Methylobacterium sp. Leaf112 TaxID=1736258 RepID=UPI0006F44870|nr:flagellar hook-associated family protein [Methylobacterium sp. Leaf112]KQP72215.1 flagellar biosynthesis protein FlgL [Methylobacterium sp. Leaf112]
MRMNATSSLSLWNAPRTGAQRMQTEIAQGTKELATGRHADVGLELGSRTGLALGLRQQKSELQALQDGNAGATLRLSTTQAALQQIQAAADSTLKTLIGVPVADRAAVVKDMAASQLAALTAVLNTAADGQSVFGGTNTGASPMTAYGAGSAAKSAVDAAFTLAGGTSMSAAGMEAFLAEGGPLDTLFGNGAWKANWSKASDTTLDSRISLSETVETSATANAPAIRRLAMAYVVASGLDLSRLPADVQAVATDRVAGLLGEASKGLVSIQANLGRAQARISDANTRLDAQKALLDKQVQAMEGIDTAETKTRIDQLTTQMQISYSLTAQLRQLSLVSYL